MTSTPPSSSASAAPTTKVELNAALAEIKDNPSLPRVRGTQSFLSPCYCCSEKLLFEAVYSSIDDNFYIN